MIGSWFGTSDKKVENKMNKKILCQGHDVNELLKICVVANKCEYVDYYISKGADPAFDDNYAIKFTTSATMMETLLKYRQINPSFNENVLLAMIYCSSSADKTRDVIINTIMNHPNMKPKEMTKALKCMIYHFYKNPTLVNRQECLIEIINHKVMASFENYDDVFTYACLLGMTKIVECLIEKITTNTNNVALMHAVFFGYIEFILKNPKMF